MARPSKRRRVCALPRNCEFTPNRRRDDELQVVDLTVDEFETIRLMDDLGYTQAECADHMQVSRTTVQAIYDSARKKIADMLVNGKGLKVQGGNFEICERAEFCCSNGCRKDEEQECQCPTENGNACPHCRKRTDGCPPLS